MSVKKILIGGGTGNIGRYLTEKLIKSGHNVSLISRYAQRRKVETLDWREIEREGLPLDTDVVINLAGKTIGNLGPWTPNLKKRIVDSRLNSTRILAKAIARSESPPKVFISASAVGIYKCDENMEYTESHDLDSQPGSETFFTNLCRRWEEAAHGRQVDSMVTIDDAQRDVTRIVHPRFGVVLAHDTKPMQMLVIPCLSGGSAVLGSGNQPFPWIHIDDTIAALLRMIEDERLSGPVNVVAPQIISNNELSNALSNACHSTAMIPGMPSPIVQLLYGKERADGILLDSPKVVPQKLLDLGFDFKFPDIGSAVDDLVKKRCASMPLQALLQANKMRSR